MTHNHGSGNLRIPSQPSAQTRALRRVLQTKVTVLGLAIVVFLVALVIVGDLLPVEDPFAMDGSARRSPPGTPGHPLGTDKFGRDILSRVIRGARISLLMALVVVAIGHLIGVSLGVITGYAGGWIDSLVCRIWDVLLSFPGLMLHLVIMSTLGAGVEMSVIAMTVGQIPGIGRLVRERVMSQSEREYVLAAQAIGVGRWRIMFKHVLPNCLTPVLISAALAVPRVIMAEAGLSYLGLGVPPPNPSWGKMIAEGQALLYSAPWISLIPGGCILLATLGFNLVGDGLRDFFDPTQLR